MRAALRYLPGRHGHQTQGRRPKRGREARPCSRSSRAIVRARGCAGGGEAVDQLTCPGGCAGTRRWTGDGGPGLSRQYVNQCDPADPRRARRGASPRVLILMTFEYIYDALRIGASASVSRTPSAAALVHAVRVVAAGDELRAASVTRRLIADVARRPRTSPRSRARLGALMQRETDVAAAGRAQHV
jgi:hypothetical protein